VREEHPLVTIATPSLQQGRWLGENLESIRRQSYSPIEQIIRDGGSTDETLSILQSAGPHVRWVSEPDSGQSNALNRALAEARGDIIGWVNSDDLLYPNAVARAVEVMMSTGADAVYGRCMLVDEQGKAIGFYRTHPFSYEALLTRNIIAQPALFFRRTMYERFGPLDESLHFSMDYEYWLRCAREAVFVYVPELFAAFRIHVHAKTTTASRAQAAEVNDFRTRYGRGVLPRWRLEVISLWTSLGGVAKSLPGGVAVVRALKWQRERQ
jgi:glycosyltransferase involved in cell wall biosynthesis